jgi:hypothetical protein
MPGSQVFAGWDVIAVVYLLVPSTTPIRPMTITTGARTMFPAPGPLQGIVAPGHHLGHQPCVRG